MREVKILRGLPASGKSTWAKSLVASDTKLWKRVNRDDIRAMLNQSAYDSKTESLVRTIRDSIVRESLIAGFNVIVDDTNLIQKTVDQLHQLARAIGDVSVEEKCFNVEIAECLKRNAERSGLARVPDEVITSMAKAAGIDKGRQLIDRAIYYPDHKEAIISKRNYTLQGAIVRDIDGTLAIVGDRNVYDVKKSVDVDVLNPFVADIIEYYYNNRAWKIVFLTSRKEKDRQVTQKFIDDHLSFLEGKNYLLLMRSDDDNREDTIVKKEIYDVHLKGKYDVRFAIEDRPRMCRMWRAELGIFCFQVSHREF